MCGLLPWGHDARVVNGFQMLPAIEAGGERV